jgi:hypothetical protein
MQSPFDDSTNVVLFACVLAIFYYQSRQILKQQEAGINRISESELAASKAAFEAKYEAAKLSFEWDKAQAHYIDANTDALWQSWYHAFVMITREANQALFDQLKMGQKILFFIATLMMIFFTLGTISDSDDIYHRTMVKLTLSDPNFVLIREDLKAVDACFRDPEMIDAIVHWFDRAWKLDRCYSSVNSANPVAYRGFKTAHIDLFIEGLKPAMPPPPPK